MRHRSFVLSLDAWAGLALLGLAIFYWMQADALPKSALGGSVGSDGLPKLLGGALAVMACLSITQAVVASPTVRDGERPSRIELLKALGFWFIAAGFVLIVPWVGYPVAVAGALMAIRMYYGQALSIRIAAFAVAGGAVFSLLFIKLLGVPMPLGVWLDFLNR